ncbi:lasso peptide biosynthesis PqqD family chaperone [Peribacillus castrilensis]|uniref:lasso peptide biosynthesis PqqD family chaperone n=1 Tax=Peribacillus TaxID=2675229 RepID=UPI0030F5309D
MLDIQKISLHATIEQSKGNIASDMDGEKVLMSIKNSKYYNLGRMGGVIWDLIEKSISTSKLIETLMSQYAVEQRECEEHVYSFLELLHKEGLIQIGDER